MKNFFNWIVCWFPFGTSRTTDLTDLTGFHWFFSTLNKKISENQSNQSSQWFVASYFPFSAQTYNTLDKEMLKKRAKLSILLKKEAIILRGPFFRKLQIAALYLLFFLKRQNLLKTSCHCERVQRVKQSARFSHSLMSNRQTAKLADCFVVPPRNDSLGLAKNSKMP